MFRRKNTGTLALGALLAALYVVLTYLSFLFGLSGANLIQCRISEALCVLAAYTPAAIPGLTVGCALSNAFTGSPIWDVVFGSAATFLGAVFTYLLRKRKYLAPVPPIFFNTLTVPFVLMYAYGLKETYFVLLFSVFLGELISSGILGGLLVRLLEKTKSGSQIKNILENT